MNVQQEGVTSAHGLKPWQACHMEERVSSVWH